MRGEVRSLCALRRRRQQQIREMTIPYLGLINARVDVGVRVLAGAL